MILDTYWLRIPNGPLYLIKMLGSGARLNYKTRDDLDKLLALSNSDKVILKGFLNPELEKKGEREMTLEEACEIFGSRIAVAHWDPNKDPPENSTEIGVIKLPGKIICMEPL